MEKLLRFLMTFILVTVWGGVSYAQTTVEQSTFSATSADNINGDKNVSYSTAKGGGTSAPALNNGVIRLYQNTAGTGGGTITITAASGYVLDKVTIGSSMKTSIAYTLNEATEKSTTESLAANGKYSVETESASSITFYCMGTDKNSRLYVNYLSVTYSSDSDTRNEPALSFPEASYTTFLGQEFTEPTLTVPEGLTPTYSMSGSIGTIDESTGKLTITAAGTATITAKTEANETYKAGIASYTLEVKDAVNGLAALKEKVTTTDEISYNLTLKDAVVTYVDGNNTYIQDAGAGFLIYVYDCTLKAGQKINGVVYIKAKTFSSLAEITSWDASDATITDDGEITIKEIKVSDISNTDYRSCLVRVKDVEVTQGFSSKSAKITQDESTATLYKKNDEVALSKGNKIDAIGFPSIYNGNIQFLVFAQKDITFKYSDTEENTYTAASEATVNLSRTLSNEYFNTFCAPFAISESQVNEVFGEGTIISKYTGESDNTMNFEAVKSIEAGVAYLVKPAQKVENPTFEGVTIAEDVAAAESAGTNYKFVGVLNPTELNIATDLFVAANNKVSKIAEGKNKINGMRAYIQTANSSDAAKALTLNIDGQTTGIEAIDGAAEVKECKVFNLQGQLVGKSLNDVKKGLYIVNGKKTVKN